METPIFKTEIIEERPGFIRKKITVVNGDEGALKRFEEELFAAIEKKRLLMESKYQKALAASRIVEKT